MYGSKPLKEYILENCEVPGCRNSKSGIRPRRPYLCRDHIGVYVSPNMYQCHICRKRASYGYIGSPPSKCSKHKLDSMVRLANNCLVPNCMKRKQFGFPDKGKVSCSQHAEPGMIDIEKYRRDNWSSNEAKRVRVYQQMSSTSIYELLSRPREELDIEQVLQTQEQEQAQGQKTIEAVNQGTDQGTEQGTEQITEPDAVNTNQPVIERKLTDEIFDWLNPNDLSLPDI